jgi:hypothetical protein
MDLLALAAVRGAFQRRTPGLSHGKHNSVARISIS